MGDGGRERGVQQRVGTRSFGCGSGVAQEEVVQVVDALLQTTEL